MAKEVEVKILEVSIEDIGAKMENLGAKKILDTKYSVDWFRNKDWQWPEHEDPWYLRIRTTSDGKTEVTWKGKSTVLGASRSHEEISFQITEPQKMADLFGKIGLVPYAHQEKFRKSWVLRDWRFDLDAYPKMPPYLEIEGKDEKHIQEAIRLLGLEQHKTSSEGELKLIREKYGLDWNTMRFDENAKGNNA